MSDISVANASVSHMHILEGKHLPVCTKCATYVFARVNITPIKDGCKGAHRSLPPRTVGQKRKANPPPRKPTCVMLRCEDYQDTTAIARKRVAIVQ